MGFQAAICAREKMPGALAQPEARGETKVASEMSRVPGTQARWA